MNVKYKNPPIHELVIGVYFESPIYEIEPQHIGLYWNTIIHEFTKSKQVPPIPIQTSQTPGPNDVFPMPRFWFISNDEVYLIQLQREFFIFNWRNKGTEYPHFDKIVSLFSEQFGNFISFCTKFIGCKFPKIKNCELSYINIVDDSGVYSSPKDATKIINNPLFSIDERYDDNIITFSNLTIFSFGDNVDLLIKIENRKNQHSHDILYFELKAVGELNSGDIDDVYKWFGSAHDVIIEQFHNITSDDVQEKYWKRR